MKIAVFHNLPDGGAKIALYEQLKRLQIKHTLSLFSFLEDSGEYDLSSFCEKVYLYPYETVSTLRKQGIRRIYEDIKQFTVLKKLHKKIAHDIDTDSFDIVYVHHDRLTQAPYLLRYLKTPNIYYCQEPLRIVYEKILEFNESVGTLKKYYEKINRRIRKNIDRKNACSTKQIITSSKYIKTYIKKVYKKNSSICPLGVDYKQFNSSKIKKKNQILFIGSKTKIDGYEFIKQVMKRVNAKRKISLKIIDFNKESKFTYEKMDIIKAYQESLLTVCTAIDEPFGLTALESMACETPVAAVNKGGYKETIVSGKTGYLVRRNIIDFTKYILLLVNNKTKLEKFGKAGREHVKNNFNWDLCIQKLEIIIEKTANI